MRIKMLETTPGSVDNGKKFKAFKKDAICEVGKDIDEKLAKVFLDKKFAEVTKEKVKEEKIINQDREAKGSK